MNDAEILNTLDRAWSFEGKYADLVVLNMANYTDPAG